LATRLRRKEPWYPNLSLFARKLTIFGYWRILLQKSAVTDDVVQRIHLDDGVLSRDPDARYAIPDIAVWRTSPFYRTTALRQQQPFAHRMLWNVDLVAAPLFCDEADLTVDIAVMVKSFHRSKPLSDDDPIS
jgi:hypothetical protein